MAAITPSDARSRGQRRTAARVGVVGKMLTHPFASFWLVLVPSVLLVGLGQLMALSASSVYAQATNDNPYYFAVRQLLFLIVGLPCAWWLARRDERTLKVLGWLGLFGSLVLLLAVFTPLGMSTKGNRAWLRFGPVGLQPSEFAKLSLIVWSAAVLGTKQKLLDQPRHLLVPLVFGFAAVEGLVLAQGDLGTGIVIAAIFAALLFLVGTPWRIMGVLGAFGAAVIGALVVISPNRMQRVQSFLHPGADPNQSQQPISALYALATGGWWGLGLGASRQKWGGLADAAQNDFVFAVIGEELGLMGTLGVLLLFCVLGYAGIRIGLRNHSLFLRLVAGGITAWLLLQAMANMAVAMHMAPVIGVPLPFISTGGSALLANLLAVGVLLACARAEPAAKVLREARKSGQAARVTTVVQSGQ